MYLPAAVFTKVMFQQFQMTLTNKHATLYPKLIFTTHHTILLFQIQYVKKHQLWTLTIPLVLYDCIFGGWSGGGVLLNNLDLAHF